MQYSQLHTWSTWYILLLLGYKPVQHVTVLNIVGNCNTVVSIIILCYNIITFCYIMGPPSYMRSVVDRNVVRRRIPVYKCMCMSRDFSIQVNSKVLCLSVAQACRTRERLRSHITRNSNTDCRILSRIEAMKHVEYLIPLKGSLLQRVRNSLQ